MKKCYCCNVNLINSNKSEEHIIPNVFGGKLKSKDILCKKCNELLGLDIDKNLCNSFEFLNILLNPKRERKTNGGYIKADINGTPIKLYQGLKYTSIPKINESFDNGNKIISGELMTSEANVKMQDNFLKNFYGKAKKNGYKGSLDDFKNLMVKTTQESNFINTKSCIDLLNVLFGYLKIAIGFCAYYNKLELVDKKILDIFTARVNSKKLMDNKKVRDDFFNELAKDIFFGEQKHFHDGRICNRVSLFGDKENKKLYAIIGIYDALHFAIILNNNYDFDSFEEKYAYDIINEKEITYSVPSYNTILEYRQNHDDLYQASFKNNENNIKYVMSFKVIPSNYPLIADLFLKFITYIVKVHDYQINITVFKEKFITDFCELRILDENLRFISDNFLERFIDICYEQYTNKYNELMRFVNLEYQNFITNNNMTLDGDMPNIILWYIQHCFQGQIEDEWSKLLKRAQ